MENGNAIIPTRESEEGISVQYLLKDYGKAEEKSVLLQGIQAHRLHHVVAFKCENNIIDAVVQASMNDRGYRVKIILGPPEFLDNSNINSPILKSECECKIGNSKCHHKAAALLKAVDSISCTSAPMSWLSRPRTAKRLLRTLMPVECYFKPPKHRSMFDIPVESSLTVKEIIEKGLSEFKYDLLTENPSCGLRLQLAEEPECSEVNPWSKYYLSIILLSDAVRDSVAQKDIETSVQKIVSALKFDVSLNQDLSMATKDQFQNDIYCHLKYGRLTASKFWKVLKNDRLFLNPEDKVVNSKKPLTRRRTKQKQLFQMRANVCKDMLRKSGTNTTVSSLRYGLDHEPAARKSFAEENKDFSVQEVGLFLDECGGLGVSPDGLVNDNAVLEIKCPISQQSNSLKELVDRNRSSIEGEMKSIPGIKWILGNKDEFTLDPSHEYWFQVQGQMAITGRELCYFYVWSPIQPRLTMLIKKDPEFNLEKLRSFYITHFLPYLIHSQWTPQMHGIED